MCDALLPSLSLRAPYYVIHKIMAGLLDAHVMVGNARAFDMVGALQKKGCRLMFNLSIMS